MFDIARKLHPYLFNKNTRNWLIILVKVCVSCALYKLAQGANMPICSIFFAIDKSIVALILYEFVKVVKTLFLKD